MKDLIDAQEMTIKNSDTFEAPSQFELSQIKEGDFVKISDGKERFWTIVLEVDDKKIKARVDNQLLVSEYNYGDIIKFELRHVYEIMKMN